LKRNNNLDLSNSKTIDLSNVTLALPILMFRHIYFLIINEYYWRSDLICSGNEAVFYVSLWLLFFISLWIGIYYKIYKFYLDKAYPVVFIYLIVNPFWVLFYYLNYYYIKNETSEENSTWVLISIIAISVILLKLYNMGYIKILKYLSQKKGDS